MISLCTHLAHPLPVQPHRAQLRGADQGTPLPGSLPWALRAGSGSFLVTPIAVSTHHPVLLTWPPARLLQALKAETWSVLLPAVRHFSEEINEAHIGAVTSSTTSVSPARLTNRRQASWVSCCLFPTMFPSWLFFSAFRYMFLASPHHPISAPSFDYPSPRHTIPLPSFPVQPPLTRKSPLAHPTLPSPPSPMDRNPLSWIP